MKTWLRLTLITLTVGGGFTGVVATIPGFYDPKLKGILSLCLVMTAITLYALTIASGLALVMDSRRTRPLKIALWLQVPWLASPFLGYFFIAGAHLTLLIQVGDTFHFSFNLLLFGSGWNFTLFHDSPWGVGVNLVPLILLRLMRPAKETVHLAADAPSHTPPSDH